MGVVICLALVFLASTGMAVVCFSVLLPKTSKGLGPPPAGLAWLFSTSFTSLVIGLPMAIGQSLSGSLFC